MTRTITISQVDDQEMGLGGADQTLEGILVQNLQAKNIEQFQAQGIRLRNNDVRRQTSRRRWVAPATTSPSDQVLDQMTERSDARKGETCKQVRKVLHERYVNLNKLSQTMRERGSSQLSPRSVMMTSSGPRLGLNRGNTTTESAAKKDAFGLPIDKLSEQVRFEKAKTQIERKS